MNEALTIPPLVVRELLAHARAALPREACGLLSGDAAGGRVRAFHPARNVADSSVAFDAHPDDLARILLGIEDGGEDLVAIFHSHPRTGAVPSATDLREAAYPVVHLIAGLAGGSGRPPHGLRAWRYGASTVREVGLTIG
jgi:proteasome lid subunit RPN8/RPN11